MNQFKPKHLVYWNKYDGFDMSASVEEYNEEESFKTALIEFAKYSSLRYITVDVDKVEIDAISRGITTEEYNKYLPLVYPEIPQQLH